MTINYKKSILFTGAGFSKNFGGFLAREMWSKIFNHPELDNLPEIKSLLKTDFDFESVYSQVIKSPDHNEIQKYNFQDIIKEAYIDMDKMLANYNFTGSDPFGVNIYGVRELLRLFVGTTKSPGLHFTLNQDLFMERHFKRQPLGLATLKYKNYLDQINSGNIDTSKSIQLPSQALIDECEFTGLGSTNDLFYIKLHGSLGWTSVDGSNRMVLGTEKVDDILDEPLLSWYFRIFAESLKMDNTKMLIIGYGFNDEHINNFLAHSITKHGLKIYIISPENPEAFKDRIASAKNNHGKVIWKGISGYFPYSLRDIYPSDQSKTHVANNLLNIFK